MKLTPIHYKNSFPKKPNQKPPTNQNKLNSQRLVQRRRRAFFLLHFCTSGSTQERTQNGPGPQGFAALSGRPGPRLASVPVDRPAIPARPDGSSGLGGERAQPHGAF